MRDEGGRRAVRKPLDGAGGFDVLGQVEVVRAGHLRGFRNRCRQRIGRGGEDNVLAFDMRRKRLRIADLKLLRGYVLVRQALEARAVAVDDRHVIVAGIRKKLGDRNPDLAAAHQHHVLHRSLLLVSGEAKEDLPQRHGDTERLNGCRNRGSRRKARSAREARKATLNRERQRPGRTPGHLRVSVPLWWILPFSFAGLETWPLSRPERSQRNGGNWARLRRIAGLPGRTPDRPMRDADSKLIALLKANAREPTASLARKLGLARSTVQEKIAKLEKDGTIEGYTVKLSDAREARRLRAIVMISADPKQADRVAAELKRMHEVRALYAVSGAYDMIAVVETETTAKMDTSLDRIGRATGVARTVSSIVLSEKFAR